MRIEDEGDGSDKRLDRIRQIQQYAEEQNQLDGPDAQQTDPDAGGASAHSTEGVDGAKSSAQLGEQADLQRAREREVVGHAENNAQILDQELSGAELHDMAVEAASHQQDQNAQWNQFSDANSHGQLPTSVEEAAEAAKKEQEQSDTIAVQDIMKDLMMRNGIPS